MINRRNFLKKLTSYGLAIYGATKASLAAAFGRVGDAERTKIVIVRDERAADSAGKVDESLVARMLSKAMYELTDSKTDVDAWKKLFKPTDVVAVKVNTIGGKAFCHIELVNAITAGLRLAGVPEQNIIIYDRTERELISAGFNINRGTNGVKIYATDSPGIGYVDTPTTFGTLTTHFSKILAEQCTALINVPFLRLHYLTGVSISFKNHLGSINNPGDLHKLGKNANPCLADLNAMAPVKSKTKLIICDALTAFNYKGLIIGTDPVAVDYQGIRIIEETTKTKVSPEPAWLATAADVEHQVGTNDPSRMNVVELKLTS